MDTQFTFANPQGSFFNGNAPLILVKPNGSSVKNSSLSSSDMTGSAVCGKTSKYKIINDTINYHGYILDVNNVKLHVKATNKNYILIETISKFNPIEFKLSSIHRRVSANDELYIKQKIKGGAPYYFSFKLKEKTETLIDDFTSNGYTAWMLFSPAYLAFHTARGNLSNCKLETICDTFIMNCVKVRASCLNRGVTTNNVIDGYSWVSDMNIIKGCLHIRICTMDINGNQEGLSIIIDKITKSCVTNDLGGRAVMCVTLYTCADTDIKNLCYQIRWSIFNDKNTVTEELRTLCIKSADNSNSTHSIKRIAKDFHVHIVILNKTSGRPHC